MKIKYRIILTISIVLIGWFGSNVYATQIAERKFGPLLGILTDYKISASAISAEVNIKNLTSKEMTIEKVHTSGDGLDNFTIKVENLKLSSKIAQKIKKDTGVDFSNYSLNAQSNTQCEKGICSNKTTITSNGLLDLSFKFVLDENTLIRIIDLINENQNKYIDDRELTLLILDILTNSQTIELSIKFQDQGFLSLLKKVKSDILPSTPSHFEYGLKLDNKTNSFGVSLLIDGGILAKLQLLLGVDVSDVDFHNTDNARNAAKGITIKSFDLILEDKGGLENFPEFNKIKEEILQDFDKQINDLELDLVMQNSPITKILLQATNNRSTEELSSDIVNFLNNPSKLEVSFKPGDPFPIAAFLPVMMGLSDGSLLLNYAHDFSIKFNNKNNTKHNNNYKLDRINNEERILMEKLKELKEKKRQLNKRINKNSSIETHRNVISINNNEKHIEKHAKNTVLVNAPIKDIAKASIDPKYTPVEAKSNSFADMIAAAEANYKNNVAQNYAWRDTGKMIKEAKKTKDVELAKKANTQAVNALRQASEAADAGPRF